MRETQQEQLIPNATSTMIKRMHYHSATEKWTLGNFWIPLTLLQLTELHYIS